MHFLRVLHVVERILQKIKAFFPLVVFLLILITSFPSEVFMLL